MFKISGKLPVNPFGNSYMVPENPLDPETQWICDNCPHRIETSSVCEIVSSFIGKV